MSQPRRTNTVRQLELLCSFMEKHRDLALGRVRSKESQACAKRLWKECALMLNPEGPARIGREWAKVWNDMKCRVKAKLIGNRSGAHGIGGGPYTHTKLSPLEEAVARIIGKGALAWSESGCGVSHIENEIEVPLPQPSLNKAEGLEAAPLRSPLQRRRRVRRPPLQGTQSMGDLDTARETLARIELLRAETSNKLAEQCRIQAECALRQAENMASLIDIAKGVACSLDKYVTHVTKKQRILSTSSADEYLPDW